MAQYELKIDLLGGEKVESILQKLQGLTGALGSGGSIFGGGSSGSAGSKLMTDRDVSNLQKGAHAAKEIARASRDAATNAAQGFKGSGWETVKGYKSPGKLTRGWTAADQLKEILGGAGETISAAASKSISVGGGIAQIQPGRNLEHEFESQHGNMFGSKEDLALSAMRQKGEKTFQKEKEREAMRAAREQAQQEAQSNKQSLAGSRLNIAMKMRAAKAAARQSAVDAKEKERQEKMLNAQSLAGSRLNISMRLKAAAKEAQSAKDATTFKKDMSFLAMPLFNPGSMWATLFSTRQTYSAMNTEHGKAFREKWGGKLGMGGIGAGAATGLLVGGATVLGVALKALTVTVQQTIAAYEHARQIYAKALTGGMGLQFTVKRSMLAEIMGVSEQDVFRFGEQMAYLNPKLEWASKILANTTTPLTKVSWEFKVLQADLSAMFSKMANDAAPAILKLTEALEGLVKTATWLYDHAPKNLVGNALAAGAGMVFGNNAGFIAKLISQYVGAGVKLDAKTAPQAWMKPLPASHWEKMGLVTMGGSANYAKDTAKNTKEIATGIKEIVKKMTGKNPSNPWGMSPQTAQP